MFPKSLLFAFVATSLFLANVGVEASLKPNRLGTFDSYLPPAAANLEKRSSREESNHEGSPGSKPFGKGTDGGIRPITTTRDIYSDDSQVAPTPITITSSLSTTPADKGFLGICSLPITPYDGIFGNGGDQSFSFVREFMKEAQKKAKCSWLSPNNVHCVEQGGEEVMDKDKMTWWQQAFCKRCSDAGGTNAVKFQCPKVDAAAGDKGEGAQSREGSKEGSKKADGGLV
ncbi:related to Mig2 protein [Ustilago bromivora]|uniref:Related to Mig2 protein n=1 Tax=Ustilago bromivora TaxID=307758 RepID=A0A1K0GBB2_9BASI|nr:related to Mig2 protein [Ustilago bromivora]